MRCKCTNNKNCFLNSKRVSHTEAIMAASVRVLDTVELLEHILYKLPMRDLLLSQRVCKQWQAVIKASKKLQCALFFEPLDGSPLLAVTQGRYRLRFIRFARLSFSDRERPRDQVVSEE